SGTSRPSAVANGSCRSGSAGLVGRRGASRCDERSRREGRPARPCGRAGGNATCKGDPGMAASPATLPSGRRLVLLAEDDAPFRRLIASVLAEEGYEVLEAGDGLGLLANIETTL